MTAVLVIIVPFLAGVSALLLRRPRQLLALLASVAVAHAALSCSCWFQPPSHSAWFAVDALGLPVLSIISALFLAAAFYTVGGPLTSGKLQKETSSAKVGESASGGDAPLYVLVSCLLFFLAAMSAVAVSQQLGLIWVAVEATTLASAPLIFFHRHHRSLEAAWKYIVLCSVGIAFAMLGNLFLAVAGARTAIGSGPLTVEAFMSQARLLDPTWLKAAFIFILVGYGTKMGLAPLHTWLPDAHSQAPAQVSALLSGALLNCAFLALLRVYAIAAAAGLADFCGSLLLFFGLLSLGWAALFLVRQTDFKRMLAYSSIENMGLIAIGAGLGSAGVGAAVLQMINHSLVKAALFMVAGNLLVFFGSKRVAAVHGAVRTLPQSGTLWFLGFLAISGLPPFGTFFSKFGILLGACHQGRYYVVGLMLVLLVVAFIGMATAVLSMYFGTVRYGANRLLLPELAAVAPAKDVTERRERETRTNHAREAEGWGVLLPPALLLGASLFLGLCLPDFLRQELLLISGYFGGF